MKQTEKYTFFWKGPLSQWHMADFRERGITYNCAEKFMMAKKALLFRDFETYDKIMASVWQKEMQELGREVRNYDQNIWDENKYNIVLKGNILKFTQDKDLQQKLLDTGDTVFVEASPFDKVWGIGMTEDDPNCEDSSKWKGQNLLGYAITDTKQLIRQFEKNGCLEHWTFTMRDL